MINLITGLPGNGKTLYALEFVKNWSEKDNRPVFYSGIADLKLPWTECEPEKWMDCPANSIIVIDECQRVFRPRANGKVVPDYVSALETHRHQGLDIVLITQHPTLCDASIRRLSGRHFHVVRKWGTQAATIHEWASVKDNCDKNSARSDSIKHAWKYPKKVFEYYKSAEVHTVKRTIPMRVFMLGVVPFLVAGAIYYIYNWVQSKQKPSPQPVVNGQMVNAAASNSPSAVNGAAQSSKPSYKNAIDDVKQYVFERTARIDGLPQTAPRYDEVTKPITAPIPSACVESHAKGCKCYSQQGTFIQMPAAICHDIVERGYFMDFDDKGGHAQQASSGSETGLTAVRSDAVPLSAVAQSQKSPVAPPVVVADASKSVNAADGYGLLGKVRKGVKKREYD